MGSGAYNSLETAGPVAQSVASLITDPWVTSSIPALPHSFMEIDCEIFSTVILLVPDSGRAVVSYNRKYVHWVLVNMTIAVDWDFKPQTKQIQVKLQDVLNMEFTNWKWI